MPEVRVGGISMHDEQQGSGEPLVLISHLAADNACYAFQIRDYACHLHLGRSARRRSVGQTPGRLLDGDVRR